MCRYDSVVTKPKQNVILHEFPRMMVKTGRKPMAYYSHILMIASYATNIFYSELANNVKYDIGFTKWQIYQFYQ